MVTGLMARLPSIPRCAATARPPWTGRLATPCTSSVGEASCLFVLYRASLLRRVFCAVVPLAGCWADLLIGIAGAAVQLPEVTVHGAKPKPKPSQQRAFVTPQRRRRGLRPAERLADADRRSQSGPQHHLCADGHGADNDQPRRDRGAPARHERHGREDRAPVSWSYPGLGRQRQFPRAQRACQCADPHQRHHAP